MATFVYKAKSKPGQLTEGRIEAPTLQSATIKLEQMGYFPVTVAEDKISLPTERRLFLFRKVRPADLGIFTRQLSNLIDSGVTLLSALDTLCEQTENKYLKSTIADIKDRVKDGATFSAALATRPDVFLSLYVSMIRSGEVSGALERVLTRLADFSERDEEIRAKVVSSLAYPFLLILVGTLTIFVLLTFVIPRLVTMFKDLGQILPLPTRILINVSNFFASFWWAIILAIFILVFFMKRLGITKEGKIAIDKFKLSLPLIGKFIKKSEIARFSRVLGTLIGSGVPMLQSLEVTSDVLDNEVIRQDIKRVQKEVTEGSNLSKSIRQGRYFPPMVVNMIAVAEEGALLENSLFKIADAYEKDVDRTIKMITSLLEPALILILGSIVGFIVISMLLPIFQINLMVR